MVDSVVSVQDAATGKSVAGGRAYTSEANNPASYVVPPGTYRVPVRPTDRTLETMVIESAAVEAEGESRHIVNFAED